MKIFLHVSQFGIFIFGFLVQWFFCSVFVFFVSLDKIPAAFVHYGYSGCHRASLYFSYSGSFSSGDGQRH